MQQFRSIQVLRAVGMFMVVLIHARVFTGVATQGKILLGAAAVDVFFVVSGFVITMMNKKPTFLYDRLWRIYPMWLIAVTAWLLFHPADGKTLATSLTLWPVFGGMVTPALGVGWTLSFDVLFYAAVALSMRIGAKPLIAAYGLMLAGAVLVRWPIFSFLGNPMMLECLFGAALVKMPRDKRLAIPLIAAAILLFAISPLWVAHRELAVRAPASAWRVLYWGVPATLLVYGCLCGEEGFKHRAWNGIVLLGTASFSIYLFHLTIIDNLQLPWMIAVPVAIGAGIALWWFVERPVTALKPKLGRKKTLVPAE